MMNVEKIFLGFYLLTLIGCSNPFGSNSTAANGFHPGIGNFFIDQNDSSAGFGGGTTTQMAWDGTHNYLRLNTSSQDLELDPSWTPAWSHIVAYWKMDESVWNGTPGEVIDSSGNGNNGTSTGGTTLTTGIIGNGGHFSSSVQGVVVTNAGSLNLGSSNVTMSLWAKSTQAATAGSYPQIFAGAGFSMEWFHNTFQQLVFSVVIGGTNYNVYDLNGPALNDGNWHHIVGVLSGGNLYLYTDGTLVSTASAALGTIANNTTIYIGGNGVSPSDEYNGTVDDIAVWNIDLSAAAVATIYQHEYSKYAGTFTSRIMDTGWPDPWLALSWTSTLPFFKELPDATNNVVQNETSANYSSLVGDTPAVGDNNLMTGIGGLWHLDGTVGAIASGATILDSSGNGANGTTNSATSYVTGKLGQGVYLTGTEAIGIPANLAPDPCNQITVSLWLNTTAYVLNYGVITRDGYLTTSPGWLIQSQPPATLAVRVDTSAGSPQGVSFNAADNFFDGNWHHVVFTLNSGNIILYKDGVPDATGTYLVGGGFCNSTQPLYIGQSLFGHNINGIYDEVAVWNKVLNASEVLELYRRGANRIKYQIQTCSSPSVCSGSSNWMGPDGTNQSYFSELNNNAIPSDGADLGSSDSVLSGFPNILFSGFSGLTLPTNRYFQYRAILESDDQNSLCNYGSGSAPCSPELKSVTIYPQ